MSSASSVGKDDGDRKMGRRSMAVIWAAGAGSLVERISACASSPSLCSRTCRLLGEAGSQEEEVRGGDYRVASAKWRPSDLERWVLLWVSLTAVGMCLMFSKVPFSFTL